MERAAAVAALVLALEREPDCVGEREAGMAREREVGMATSCVRVRLPFQHLFLQPRLALFQILVLHTQRRERASARAREGGRAGEGEGGRERKGGREALGGVRVYFNELPTQVAKRRVNTCSRLKKKNQRRWEVGGVGAYAVLGRGRWA
jgi:hypothetical protein